MHAAALAVCPPLLLLLPLGCGQLSAAALAGWAVNEILYSRCFELSAPALAAAAVPACMRCAGSVTRLSCPAWACSRSCAGHMPCWAMKELTAGPGLVLMNGAVCLHQ
jgi:hypothetical protein